MLSLRPFVYKSNSLACKSHSYKTLKHLSSQLRVIFFLHFGIYLTNVCKLHDLKFNNTKIYESL